MKAMKLTSLVKVNETDKAVAVKGWCSSIYSDKSWEISIWIPKAIIKNDIIPDWFLDKKYQEFYRNDKKVIFEVA